MTKSSTGGKARASARAALECNNQKMDPSCTECTDIPPVRAVILYPNLGTPLVLPPGEKKINIFIAAEGKSHRLFGTTTHSKAFPQPSVVGYMYVDKHLRSYPISAKKLSDDTKAGRLWNDGKLCSKAFSHVKVWCLGPLSDGTITDIDGKMVANIRPSTIERYNNTAPAHPDDEDPLVDNPPLDWIYQVQIDLAALPNPPAAGKIISLAWMMQVPDGYKKQKALAGMSDWEYQDKLIYDFLESQKHNPAKSHLPDLYEFDIASVQPDKLPKLKKEIPRRLKAWHPVSIGKNATLKIGHLSDVHVNSRQFALASANAAILEGFSPKIGPSVDNCFLSLKELFDNMKAAGADAIFLTGDLLDFNRNLDPREIKGRDPKDQWGIYNLVDNASNSKLYPRGIDDMLIFSLLRYSYEKLKLPVFITTGNHEAYDVPYGISPRANPFVAQEATKQMLSDNSVVIPARLRALARKGQVVYETSSKASAKIRNIPWVGKHWQKVTDKKDELLQKAKKTYDLDPNNYAIFERKMNEGIPGDHNLTIYEACLIFGPSFPQVVKPFNFMPDNFDWFFTLFTPLADFRIDYKEQVLLGLDWGDSEIMVNADISWGEAGTVLWREGTDGAMGALTGLPRADKSLNEKQKKIVTQVTGSGKKVLLFSHFTLINYDMPVPLDHKTEPFAASDNVFNAYTKGTFSIGRDFLYPKLNKGIHYTLAGHSHRSGVYCVDNKDPKKMTAIGFQPAEFKKTDDKASKMHNALFPSKDTSRVAVSSCGGPIGVQNLKGEMYGWNMFPPSGTLVDINASGPSELQRVVTKKYKGGKPRFCVALDYMQTHAKKQVIMWIPIGDYVIPKGVHAHYWILFANVLESVPCVASMTLHVWDSTANTFVQFMVGIGAHPTEKNTYDSYIINADDFFDMVLPKNSIQLGPPVFCEIKFNQALAGSPLYNQYNFDDPWIFRVDVQADPPRQAQLRPAESFRAEIPDWDWLASVDPARYPPSDSKQKK